MQTPDIKNKPTKFWNIVLDGEEEASIDIYGEIADTPHHRFYGDDDPGLFVTPKDFTEALNKCKRAKNITVKINSGGGDLYIGMAIYNTLKAHPAHIEVVIDGIAASAASVIAMAGDTVKVHAGSVIMVHNASATLLGNYNAADLGKIANGLKTADSAIAGVYAAKTGKDEGTLKAMMTRETWMTGSEAVEQGFADELITYGEEPMLIAASANGKRALVSNGVTVISDFTPPENAADLGIAEDAAQDVAATNNQEEDTQMDNKTTVDTTDNTQQPAPAAAATPMFTAEEVQAAVAEALKQERARLAAIDEISNGVDPGLIARAKYGDEKTEPMTAEAFALHVMRINAKSKAKNEGAAYLAARSQELAASGANNVTPAPVSADGTNAAPALDLKALAQKAAEFNRNR